MSQTNVQYLQSAERRDASVLKALAAPTPSCVCVSFVGDEPYWDAGAGLAVRIPSTAVGGGPS